MAKAIINGRIYNTQTATEVAHYDNGLGTSDFKNFSEHLYVTKRGRWFLWGCGGPASPYGRRVGDMWASSGSAGSIRPLEPEDAQNWLEGYGHTDALEQYFADKLQEA